MCNVKIQLVCILLLFTGAMSIAAQRAEGDKAQKEQNYNLGESFYINDEGNIVYTPQKARVNTPSALTSDTVVESRVETKTSVSVEDIRENNREENVNTETQSVATTPTNANVFVSKKKHDVVNTAPPAKTEKVESAASSTHPKKAIVSKQDQEIISSPQAISGFISKEERALKKDLQTTSQLQAEVAEDTLVEDAQLQVDEDEYVPFAKRKPTYNSLEEANLAVDQLLSELKKQQNQIDTPSSKSNSLSSRVVRGYTPNQNRKDSKAKAEASEIVSESDEESPFGTDPTYYINGVRVEKEEVLKLRNKNILSRTMKIQDTASGNPNGEIWIETRNK